MLQLNQKIWMIVVGVGGLLGSGSDVISRDCMATEMVTMLLPQSDVKESEEGIMSVSLSDVYYPDPYVLFGENEDLCNTSLSSALVYLDKTINLTGWVMQGGISYGVRVRDAVPYLYLVPKYLVKEGMNSKLAEYMLNFVLSPVLYFATPNFDNIHGF